MISIIVPNLNTPVEFLEPRLNSILGQSYKNWECIVIDGYSTNGSWEIILDKTANDKRFTYYQKPARGIYDAWNEGIKLSVGQYICIATSDDICEHNFLEMMAAALDDNPDCDLAHCCLSVIDETGKPTPYQWQDWEKVKFYGEHINQSHKRVAPYDAIVHFGWSTVYSSIIQLLIRKKIFEKVGLFNIGYGAVADFEWGLRASLVASVIHVPNYLASWRKHNGQATDDNYFNTDAFFSLLISMSEHALGEMMKTNEIKITGKNSLFFNYLLNQFKLTKGSGKLALLIKTFKSSPFLALKLTVYWLFRIRLETAKFLTQELVKRNMTLLLHD